MVAPSFSAFIAEISKEENRGKVNRITVLIYQICEIIGPVLGGFIPAQFRYKVKFLVAVILHTLAAGLRIWMAATMKSASSHETQDLSWKSFGLSVKALSAIIA